MRIYEKTHPWITFAIDFRKAHYSLWVILGECQSKCEHIADVPLLPIFAKHLHQVYLAKGTQATAAIEGNTLTEEQVIKQLEGKLDLPPSQEYLKKEIDNILKSCNLIIDDIKDGTRPELCVERIKTLNGMVLDGLSLDDDVVPGEIRRHVVGVAHYRAAPPEDCEYLLDKLCSWLNSDDFSPPGGMVIVDAILKAIITHIYLALIHPFGDGNGRTARLVEFQILISSGVPAPAAQLLSSHYNQTRTEYYRQLDRISKTKGEVWSFIQYAAQGFLDGLKEQLKIIREQQWIIAWRDYINEQFGDKTSDSYTRKKHLALDLYDETEPVPISKLPEISTRLARAYTNKSRKTLSRDINELVKMGLVENTEAGVRARKEIILAFLPIKADLDQ